SPSRRRAIDSNERLSDGNANIQKVAINSRAQVGIGLVGVNISGSIIAPHVGCILSRAPTWRIEFTGKSGEILERSCGKVSRANACAKLQQTLTRRELLIGTTHIIWSRAWDWDGHE